MELPPFSEQVIGVPMDAPLQVAYQALEEQIKNAIKEHHLNHSVVSVGLNALLLYPDHAWNIGDLYGYDYDPETQRRERFLIAQPEDLDQEFVYANGNPMPQYFQPRPSDAGTGYDGASSGASNLGPSNPLLVGFVAGVNTVGLNGKPSAVNSFATPADPACVPTDPQGNPVTSPAPSAAQSAAGVCSLTERSSLRPA